MSLFATCAGGQAYIDVDYIKNKVRIADVNTMLESVPSKVTRKKWAKHRPITSKAMKALVILGINLSFEKYQFILSEKIHEK